MARHASSLADDPNYLNTLGAALFRRGHLIAAESCLRQAMRQRSVPDAFDAGFLALTLLARRADDHAWTMLGVFRALHAVAHADEDRTALASELNRAFGK